MISRCVTRSARCWLSHLTALDFYVSYWSEGPVGHTFVSFIFDNAPPLSISIETRPEVGEGFAPIASMFKQFELIYVVGDERDLVRVRTNIAGGRVLYRLNASRARAPAVPCLSRADQRDRGSAGVLSPAEQQLHHQHRALREHDRPGRPVRHPSLLQRVFDSYLYDRGLDTSLPFDELRRPRSSTRLRRRPMMRRTFPNSFAHPCRRSLADTRPRPSIRSCTHKAEWWRRPPLLRQVRFVRDRRAAEQRDELAALHSITSSARASRDGGTFEAERLGGLEVDHQARIWSAEAPAGRPVSRP